MLVVSHNAFSQTNNMGKTLLGLFHSFDNDNIAQLYFHILKPDVKKSKTLFRITDRDVLKSIIKPNNCGSVINIDLRNESNSLSLNSKVYQYGQKRTATKHLIRDLMWKIGHWKSKNLINWLDDFKPDVIFFAAGYSMFAMNIAMFIAKKYNIPLVTYFCDDYYDFAYNSHRYSLVSDIRMKLFRRKIKEVVNMSNDLVFISETMMNKYKDLFNKSGKVIMTPYSLSQQEQKNVNNPLVISFVGSVLSNRWKTLRKVGEALENINSEGVKIVLNIYSVANDQDIISRLSLGQSMRFKGAADTEMVKQIYSNSDILLHVESFASEDISRVKHSISTKIADCLASNRAFLAVGPKDIASIDYLKKNHAAYIVDDENAIESKLNEYFIENKIEDQIIKNAKVLAEGNHNINLNSQRLKIILNKC